MYYFWDKVRKRIDKYCLNHGRSGDFFFFATRLREDKRQTLFGDQFVAIDVTSFSPAFLPKFEFQVEEPQLFTFGTRSLRQPFTHWDEFEATKEHIYPAQPIATEVDSLLHLISFAVTFPDHKIRRAYFNARHLRLIARSISELKDLRYEVICDERPAPVLRVLDDDGETIGYFTGVISAHGKAGDHGLFDDICQACAGEGFIHVKEEVTA